MPWKFPAGVSWCAVGETAPTCRNRGVLEPVYGVAVRRLAEPDCVQLIFSLPVVERENLNDPARA